MGLFKEALKQQAEGFRKLNPNMVPGAWILQQLLVNNAVEQEGQPLPARFKRGYPKMCFANSARLMKRSKGTLQYFEGYAFNKEISWPFHHAWNVDKKGNIVDVTFDDPTKYTYLGLYISREDYVAQAITSTSVFDTQRGMNIKFMLKIDPSLIELIPDQFKKYFID